jgi:nicotinamidase-related amidase
MASADLKDSELTSVIAKEDAVLLLIDHQPQMIFAARSSTDPQNLVNNVTALAKMARLFQIPTILTSIEAESFGGHLIPELREVFPGQEVIDRTFINAWQDGRIRDAVASTGRKKLIIAGLWTEVCLALAALSAKEQGVDVYAVVDASAGSSHAAHDAAIQRMVQAYVVPVSVAQLLSEFQRDWARKETYGPTNEIVKQHMGAWGQGVTYVKEFFK